MKSPDNQTGESIGTEKYFTVHADMLMDVLLVITTNNIHSEVKSVSVDTNSILLFVRKKDKDDHYAKAIENIEAMLSAYQEVARLLQ
jgi:hypothetical protein